MNNNSYELKNGLIYKIPERFLFLLEQNVPNETIFLKAWELLDVQYIDIKYDNIKYSVMFRNDTLHFAYFDLSTWYLIPFFNYQYTFNNKLVDVDHFEMFHNQVKRLLKSKILT